MSTNNLFASGSVSGGPSHVPSHSRSLSPDGPHSSSHIYKPKILLGLSGSVATVKAGEIVEVLSKFAQVTKIKIK
jgi:hypothetical protein